MRQPDVVLRGSLVAPQARAAWAGGGARAFAHVGVLRELEDAGLHVDRVAGSSVGAILAAAHASGLDGEALEEVPPPGPSSRRPTAPST